MPEVKHKPQDAQYDWQEYTPVAGTFFAKFYSESEKVGSGLLVRPDASKRREIVGEVLKVGGFVRRNGEILECPVGVGGVVIANPDYGTEIQRGTEKFDDGDELDFIIKILGFSDIVAYKRE